MKNDIVLQTIQLKKYFGSVHAVEEVSLSVERGEIFGFLGPNGAGKTTTIGMLLSLIHPTSGEAYLFGERVSPYTNRSLQRVGALVGQPSLVPYLTAHQNLELAARLHGRVKPGRMDEVLDLVDLGEAAGRRAGAFSTGMKQRLGLALALLHGPELLILDEPTNGMDPAGMREMRVLLKELSANGVTVFLSSHLLHEVEQICDRAAVLDKGRVVSQGAVSQLAGRQELVKVRVPSPSEAATLLRTLPGACQVRSNGAYVTVSGVESREVVALLTSNGIIPTEVTNTHTDLETSFLELTGNGS